MKRKVDSMNEEWRQIQGYEGLYEVSNLGRVKSLKRGNCNNEKLLKLREGNRGGYLVVILYKDKKRTTYNVHKLVAMTFIPNPENKPYINHKIESDEGKKINMVIFNEDGTINEEKTTIEWVTPKENNDYGTRNERVSKAMTNGKLSKKVLQLSLSGELIREWPSTRECGRNGFNQGNIVSCCNGKLPHYKGFLWMYADDYKEKQLKELGCLPLW